MSETNFQGETTLPSELTPLGTYCWPQGETTQALEYIFEKLKSKVPWRGDDDVTTPENLHTLKEQSAVDAAQTRLCSVLFECLDQTYGAWISDETARPQARVFVHAPVDHSVLQDWASKRGYLVLNDIEDLQTNASAKVIVIPQLDAHLLRHEDALVKIRDTLKLIANADTKIIVGCNSWAWRYLRAVTSLNLVFDRPDTIPAFDANALAALLKPVIAQNRDPAKFMSADTDKPIFQCDDDGALNDPFFAKLAKRSLGLPWVAIEMFFCDTVSASDEEQNTVDDRVWLRLSAPPTLPSKDNSVLCMALQNLLIHGPSSTETLAEICPKNAPDYLWTVLERFGFIETTNKITHISTYHYPAIRSALSTAGLNLDKL